MSKEGFPKGWHLKSEFIDPKTGDVYNRGKLVRSGSGNATPPVDPYVSTPPPATSTPPPATSTPPETKTETMSPEVRALLARMAELEKKIQTQQPHSINVHQDKVPFGDYDDSRIVDKENDFLPQPIQYIKHGRGYSLSGYFRNGVQVLAPHNVPIYFSREFDDVTYHEGNQKIVPFCAYVCNSKSDSEFIENCPHYGVTIFKGLQNARNIDLEMIDKYEGAIINVQRMTDDKLMAACVSKGIDLHQTHEALKAQLIKQLMVDYQRQEEHLIGVRQEEMKKEVMSPPTI